MGSENSKYTPGTQHSLKTFVDTEEAYTEGSVRWIVFQHKETLIRKGAIYFVGRKMVIDPSQVYILRWFGSPGTAYYQGTFFINYLEKKSGEIQSKRLAMTLNPVLEYPDEAVFSQNVSGTFLLQTLKENIPVLDSVSRKIVNLDFTFVYGGVELALFSNSGINPLGLSDRVYDYTNLDNARGVFSSISRLHVYGIPLSEQSADTIALNSITKNLNFVSTDEEF